MPRKSQAALEFLTTYAWAFVVILIMIGALSYFGILKPRNLLPDRCNFASEIGCIDKAIDSSGTLNLKLKNSIGEPITIPAPGTTGIVLESDSQTSITCNLATIGGAPPGATYAWGSGRIIDIMFDTCDFAAGFIEGDKAKVFVTINYYLSKSDASYTHQVAGEIFATVT